jgi:DNA-nicking Smr family endonuclease
MARPSDRDPRTSLSRRDLALWRRVAADVSPIQRRRRGEVSGTASPEKGLDTPPQPGPPQREGPPPPEQRPIRKAAQGSSGSPATALGHGIAPGLDKRTLLKLRRGLIPVDGQLDLHGCTYDEGRRTVERFLAACQAAGRRCVLIITGRGLRQPGSGVLRGAVPAWLNEPENRSRVLGFSFATPADGGDGALYVLLRRQRNPSRRNSADG